MSLHKIKIFIFLRTVLHEFLLLHAQNNILCSISELASNNRKAKILKITK